MLRARSPDGVDAIRTWKDSHGELLGWTTGPRLVDCWFVPDEGTFLAVVDGPDEESFRPLVGSTADALGVPAAEVELHPLIDPIPDWPFRGEPAVADPTRREPRPTRWERIDIGPDDRTLRISFVHGIANGLHHVDIDEDDEEVRVSVFLGLNHEWGGGGYVLIGIGGWVAVRTKEPVGRRYVNDGWR